MQEYSGLLAGFIRFTTFIFLLPVFSIRQVPFMVKAGLGALLAFLVFPEPVPVPVDTFGPWAILILQEFAVGLILGFVVILTFAAVYFAGQLIDVPMGFGLVSVFDPATGTQLPLFSQFYHLLASLVFFAVDGHLWLLQALLGSYDYIPAASWLEMQSTAALMTELGGNVFRLGLQIAIPISGTILLTDVALGMVIRTVPQINVFVIGFPIKITIGMVMVFFVMPLYVHLLASLFARDGYLMEVFLGLLAAWGGT